MLLLLAFLKAQQLMQHQQQQHVPASDEANLRSMSCTDSCTSSCISSCNDRCYCIWLHQRVYGVLLFSCQYRLFNRRKLPDALLLLLLLRPPDKQQRQQHPQQELWTWEGRDLLGSPGDTFVCRLLLMLTGRLPNDDSPLRLAAIAQQCHEQQQKQQQPLQHAPPQARENQRRQWTEEVVAGNTMPLLPWWEEAQLLQDSSEAQQVDKDVLRSFTAWKFSRNRSTSSNSSIESDTSSSGSFLSLSDGPPGAKASSHRTRRPKRRSSSSKSRSNSTGSSNKNSCSGEDLQCLHDSLRLVLLGLLSRHLPTLVYAQGLHDVVAALLLTIADAIRQLLEAAEVYRLMAARGFLCACCADRQKQERQSNSEAALTRGLCICCCDTYTTCLKSSISSNSGACSPELLAFVPCGCLLRSCLRVSAPVGIDAAVSPSSGVSLLCCHFAFLLSERTCLCCINDYLAAPFEASLLPAVRLVSLLLQQQDPELSVLLRLCSAAAAHTPGGEMLPCVSWLVTWFTHVTNPFKRTARLLDCLFSLHPQFVLHVAAAAVRSQRRRLFAVCRCALSDCSTALQLQEQDGKRISLEELCARLQQQPDLLEVYRDLVGDAVYGEVHAVLQRVQLERLPLEQLLLQARNALLHEVPPQQLLDVAATDGLELLPFSPFLLPFPGPYHGAPAFSISSSNADCCCVRMAYNSAFFSLVAPSMPPIAASYRNLGSVGGVAAAAGTKGRAHVVSAAAAVPKSWAVAMDDGDVGPVALSLVCAATGIVAASSELSPCRCVCSFAGVSATAIRTKTRTSFSPGLYRYVPVHSQGAKGWREPLPSAFLPLEDVLRMQSSGLATWLPVRLLQHMQESSSGAVALMRCMWTTGFLLVRPSGFFFPFCMGAVVCLALLLQWLGEMPRTSLLFFRSSR